MEIRYKRDPNVSHMIFENVDENDGFEDRMITENDIPCLLKYAKSGANGYCSYWYDISAKKSMKAYFSQEGITPASVYDCLKGMSDGLSMLNKYLLNSDNIVIKPETVFFRNDGVGLRSYFAYVPGLNGDFAEGFASVAEFLISNVDHDDKDSVGICYSIFETVHKGDFTLGELMDVANISLKTDTNPFENQSFTPDLEDADKDIEYELPPVLGSPESIFGEVNNLFEEQTKQPVTFFSFFKPEGEKPSKQSKKKSKVKGNKKKTVSELLFGKKKEEIIGVSESFEDFIMDPTEQPSSNFATTLLTGAEFNLKHSLVYEGRGNYPDLDIEKTPFVIGSRESGNDGVIKEGVISRTHARITIVEDEYFIEDLESRNGTFLNGQILNFGKVAKLTPGDRISFANIGYRFR